MTATSEYLTLPQRMALSTALRRGKEVIYEIPGCFGSFFADGEGVMITYVNAHDGVWQPRFFDQLLAHLDGARVLLQLPWFQFDAGGDLDANDPLAYYAKRKRIVRDAVESLRRELNNPSGRK